MNGGICASTRRSYFVRTVRRMSQVYHSDDVHATHDPGHSHLRTGTLDIFRIQKPGNWQY